MPTSLLALVRAGGSLAAPPGPVSYPAGGASELAKHERDHFWFVVRRAVVRTLLELGLPSNGPRIGLDVGCGSGYTAVWLSENGFPTIGVDAHDGFKDLRDARRGPGFVVGDIFSIEPVGEFDFLLLLDVLEHLDDDSAFLGQALKFLKPGGIAVVSVPAFSALWTAVDDFSEHRRRYTKRSMRRTVARAGARTRVVRQTYFYGSTLPLYLLARRKPRYDQEAINRSERSVSPLLNRALATVLGGEARLLSLGGLPFGSSLFTALEKSSATECAMSGS